MKYNEMMKIKREQELNQPCPSNWFKHKITGEFEYQINIMEINDYVEVQK